MRSFASGILDALDAGSIVKRNLVLFEVQSGNKGFWDDVYDITISGQVYEARPGGFTVTPIASSGDQSVRNVDVVFSGLDSEAVSLAQNEVWHQRPASCGAVFFDPETRAQLGVVWWFRGRMDHASWQEKTGGKAELLVRLEGLNREIFRSNSRTRSDADQRRRNADDGFFKHVAAAGSTEIYWGRKNPAGAGGFRASNLAGGGVTQWRGD